MAWVPSYSVYTGPYSPKVTAAFFFVGIALIVLDYTICRKKIKGIEQEILSGKTGKEVQKLYGKIQFF